MVVVRSIGGSVGLCCARALPYLGARPGVGDVMGDRDAYAGVFGRSVFFGCAAGWAADAGGWRERAEASGRGASAERWALGQQDHGRRALPVGEWREQVVAE